MEKFLWMKMRLSNCLKTRMMLAKLSWNLEKESMKLIIFKTIFRHGNL